MAICVEPCKQLSRRWSQELASELPCALIAVVGRRADNLAENGCEIDLHLVIDTDQARHSAISEEPESTADIWGLE